jgi:hypothetical protein
VLIVNPRPSGGPRFAARIPRPWPELGLLNPYPELNGEWEERGSVWSWEVRSVEDIPDVSKVVDLTRPFHPETGPMRTSTAASGEQPGLPQSVRGETPVPVEEKLTLTETMSPTRNWYQLGTTGSGLRPTRCGLGVQTTCDFAGLF